eukprot:5425361-Pleurochrysis_carterae.AAC.1
MTTVEQAADEAQRREADEAAAIARASLPAQGRQAAANRRAAENNNRAKSASSVTRPRRPAGGAADGSEVEIMDLNEDSEA